MSSPTDSLTSSRRMLVLVTALIFLALVSQLPFLLQFTTPAATVLGRYSVKFSLFLLAYLLITGAVGVLGWRVMRMTADRHAALLQRTARYSRWAIPIMAGVVGAVLLPAFLIEQRFIIDSMFLFYWEWIIVVIVLIESLILLLLPVSAYQGVDGMLTRMAGAWHGFMQRRAVSIAGIVLGVTLALIPPLWMASNTLLTGEGSAGNDQLVWVPMITRVLAGTYDWRQLPQDSAYQGHILIVAALIQIVDAILFNWDQGVLIGLGFVVSAVTAWLLTDIVRLTGTPLPRWLTLPLFSLLLFLPTHLSTFSFGMPSTERLIVHLGLTLGVWALTRFGATWRGVLLISATGLLTAWSSGNGLLALPCLFIGVLLMGGRNIAHYALIAAVAVLSFLPRLIYTGGLDIIEAPRLIEAIGWYFYHVDWPYSTNVVLVAAGVTGVALAAGYVIITLAHLVSARDSSRQDHRAVPGIVILMFGAGTILLITVVRNLLTPWYTTNFAVFWIGLAVLACTFWPRRDDMAAPPDRSDLGMVMRTLSGCWSIAALIAITGFALTHRLSALDYIWLWGRTPASASCWRTYATAPTSCQWLIGHQPPSSDEGWRPVAASLEQYHLATFAPRQRWTLQGDWSLDTVSVQREDQGDAAWSADRTVDQPLNLRDYRHLNLILQPPAQVRWTVTLPDGIKHVELRTAASSEGSAPLILIEADGNTPAEIFASEAAGGGWQAVKLSLDEYVGQTITLIFTANSGGTAPISYRYPYLAVEFDKADMPTPTDLDRIQPGNTDLAPSFPQPSDADWIVDLSGMVPDASGQLQPDGWETAGEIALLLYQAEGLDLCAAGYTHLLFEAAVPAAPASQSVLISYRAAGGSWRHFPVPLLQDGRSHRYSADLRLFGLPAAARLDGLRVWMQGLDDPVDFEFTDLRLAAGSGDGSCD